MTNIHAHPERRRLRERLSALAAHAAEYLISMVPTVTDQVNEHGDMITRARLVRVYGLRLLDCAVMTELASGATWEQVAEKLGWPLQMVLDRYQKLWEQVSNGAELTWPDLNMSAAATDLMTAAELDAWYKRVAGPDAPSRAISDGLY